MRCVEKKSQARLEIAISEIHEDVMTYKHFTHRWFLAKGNHWWPVDSVLNEPVIDILDDYLPKLHFGKYVTQSVCLYVCLFVCLWRCPTISQEQIVRSSPNLVHIWNLELRRDLLILVLMTSLMTSSGPKVGQILKLPYLSQFLSYSVETKTEMQRWLWDIILLWLISGVTSGASGSTLNFDIKMAAIFKIHVAY